MEIPLPVTGTSAAAKKRTAIGNPSTAAPLSLTRAAPTNDLVAGTALGQVVSALERFASANLDTESFANDNQPILKITTEEPVSTFSIDLTLPPMCSSARRLP
jgi:hypothetical protein